MSLIDILLACHSSSTTRHWKHLSWTMSSLNSVSITFPPCQLNCFGDKNDLDLIMINSVFLPGFNHLYEEI
jgi:hypothetical protein